MPKPKTEAAFYERLTVRLPARLMAQLRMEALAIGRPINTHIIWSLQEARESPIVQARVARMAQELLAEVGP